MKRCIDHNNFSLATSLLAEKSTEGVGNFTLTNSYNLLFNALAKNGDIASIEKLFEQMNERAVPADIFTYATLLAAFNRSDRSDAIEKCEMLWQRMLEQGIKPNLVVYGTYISMYARRGKSDNVQELLNEMRADGLQLNVVIYSMLLRMWVLLKNSERVEETFAEMLKHNVEPNEYVFRYFLYSCLFFRTLGHSLFLFFCLCSCCLLRAYCVSVLAEWHADRGDVPTVRRVLAFMTERQRVTAATIHYNSLVKACLVAGRMREAEEAVEEMHAAGIEPNAFTYNQIIHAYTQRGSLEGAWRWLNALRASKVEMNEVLYGTMIHLLCEQNNPVAAEAAVKEMAERGIQPSQRVYNTLVHGYARTGAADKVQALLQQMVNKGLPLDALSYTPLLQMHCDRGNMQEAQQLFEHMKSHVAMTINVYNVMLRGFAEFRDEAAVDRLLQEMKRDNIQGDVATFCTLGTMYSKLRQYETRAAGAPGGPAATHPAQHRLLQHACRHVCASARPASGGDAAVGDARSRPAARRAHLPQRGADAPL